MHQRVRKAAALLTALAAGLLVPPALAEPARAGDAAPGLTRGAVEESLPRLDRIVRRVMRDTGVPGIAVGVVHGDRTVYTRGYGARSTETGEKVTPRTVFQIASLSKPVSGTVVAAEVGTGTFAWTDPVHDALPSFVLGDPYVTEHVTYADLFAMHAGIPGNAGNDLEALGYDRATILERMRHLPLSPFRASYHYSNFSLTAGGEAAAAAAGTTWEDLAEQALFAPAGMTSTSARYADFLAAPNRTELHIRRDGQWVPDFERAPDAQAPAGGVSSTVVDLSRWMRVVLGDGTLDDTTVVELEALTEMLTPTALRGPLPTPTSSGSWYGLGWNVATDPAGQLRWSHSGAFSVGAATTATLLPQLDVGIVVLTNGAPIGAPEAITDMYLDVLEHGRITRDWVEVWGDRFAGIYGEPEDLADPPADATPAAPSATYVGTYANDYVGPVEIRANGNELALVAGPMGRTLPLTHYDGDVFTYVPDPELPDFLSSVRFVVGPDAVATAVEISTFAANGAERLLRV